MFLKSSIPFICLPAATVLMMVATDISAQEVVRDQGAYERYVSRIPNLPILQNGGRADLLIEYFANPQGHVASTNYAAIESVQNEECKLYFQSNGSICYCANTPPGYLGCIGSNNGPSGGTLRTVDLDVQVAPELSAEGNLLSFSVNVETIQTQNVGRFKVEGFDSDEAASQLRLKVIEQ